MYDIGDNSNINDLTSYLNSINEELERDIEFLSGVKDLNKSVTRDKTKQIFISRKEYLETQGAEFHLYELESCLLEKEIVFGDENPLLDAKDLLIFDYSVEKDEEKKEEVIKLGAHPDIIPLIKNKKIHLHRRKDSKEELTEILSEREIELIEMDEEEYTRYLNIVNQAIILLRSQLQEAERRRKEKLEKGEGHRLDRDIKVKTNEEKAKLKVQELFPKGLRKNAKEIAERDSKLDEIAYEKERGKLKKEAEVEERVKERTEVYENKDLKRTEEKKKVLRTFVDLKPRRVIKYAPQDEDRVGVSRETNLSQLIGSMRNSKPSVYLSSGLMAKLKKRNKEDTEVELKQQLEEYAALPKASSINAVRLVKDYPNYREEIQKKGLEEKVRELLEHRTKSSPTLKNSAKAREGWKKAVAFCEKLATKDKITLEDLETIQKLIHEEGIAAYLPDNPEKRKQSLETFLGWLNSSITECKSGKANPIVVAAQAYRYGFNCQGYADGNTRTARLLMDLVLDKFNLPPSHIVLDKEGSFVNFQRLMGNIDELVKRINGGIIIWSEALGLDSPFI